MGFTKLDEGILQSSVMAESSDTFKVWVALLAACKQDGVARVSPIFISSICRLDQPVVDGAIATLESPDSRSRSTEDDGRRIRRVDGGFFVINYQKYREFTLSDSSEAIRQRRHREMVKTRDNALHVTTSRDISASVFCLKTKSLKIKTILLHGREWDGITDEDRVSWAKAYPACDIVTELAKAVEWILANPARGKKSNYRRFITNWLSRSQDRGGTIRTVGKRGDDFEAAIDRMKLTRDKP
jgi:hypothetical protein